MAAGFSLLETTLVLVLAGLTAAEGIIGARALSDSLQVEAARRTVIDTLLEGRRLAYATDSTVTVRVPMGASTAEIPSAGRRVELPSGVTITASPADGGVDFRATSLADNATVALAKGTAKATIVVNQRGMVR